MITSIREQVYIFLVRINISWTNSIKTKQSNSINNKAYCYHGHLLHCKLIRTNMQQVLTVSTLSVQVSQPIKCLFSFNFSSLDVNECELGEDNCHANADCMNTEGSFECECKTGYRGDGVDTCDEIREFENPQNHNLSVTIILQLVGFTLDTHHVETNVI